MYSDLFVSFCRDAKSNAGEDEQHGAKREEEFRETCDGKEDPTFPSSEKLCPSSVKGKFQIWSIEVCTHMGVDFHNLNYLPPLTNVS